jgi:ankyrin repeat protein
MANVDFTTENHAGNTPLNHAVAYGRYDVVQWLKDGLNVEDSGSSAENLAMDFVNWADMGVGLIAAEDEVERRRVYSLFNSFEDWAKEEQEI